jgi:hypothetical protein
VPNVPPTLDGAIRRSYVLWREFIAPLIILEFVSGDGREERDQTPWAEIFWGWLISLLFSQIGDPLRFFRSKSDLKSSQI